MCRRQKRRTKLLGTSLALLLRSTCQLGTSSLRRVPSVSAVGRARHRRPRRRIEGVVVVRPRGGGAGRRGPGHLGGRPGDERAPGDIKFRRARRATVKRLGKATVTIGLITAAALAAAAGPISMRSFPTDTAAAKSTKTIFRWAALSVPLVWPNALCEAVLLGAGPSPRLFGRRDARHNATRGLLRDREHCARRGRLVTSAWACLCGFFVLRFAVSAGGAARGPFPRTARAGCAIARRRRRLLLKDHPLL